MALRSRCCVPLLTLLLLGAACGPGAEPCEGEACPGPTGTPPTPSFDPCGDSFDCGWMGFGQEGLAVPTPLQPGALVRVGSQVYERSYAFFAQAGRIYTFTCIAEGFERCALQLGGMGYTEAAFMEEEGRTTRAHVRPRFDQAYFVSVRALPDGSAGAFRYALAEREDDHANDAAGATALAVDGTPQPGRLDVGPDTDAFSFEAQAGHFYVVRCEGTFGWETRFGVTGPDAAPILGAGSSAEPGRGLQFVAARSGRHDFSLVADGTPSAIDYTCRVEDRGPDDHGSTQAAATLLPEAASLPLTGALGPAYDEDYFRFEARAGHAYALRCEPATQEPCTSSRFLDARGNVLPRTVGFVQATPLFVLVEAFGSWTGTYALAVEDLGADEGSGAQDAVLLALDAPRAGHLVRGGDEDFFRFEAQAQRVYRVSVEGRAVEASPLSAPEQSLTRYDRGSPGRLFMLSAQGPVLLRVSGEPGDYSVRVEALGMDDHADAPGSASPLGSSLSGGGQLDTSTDVDWFGVQLQQRPYVLQGSARDTQFLLFEPDGLTPVPWDVAAGAYVPRAAGPHLVRADMFGYFTAQDAYLFELLPR